jgi:hypothetical protein
MEVVHSRVDGIDVHKKILRRCPQLARDLESGRKVTSGSREGPRGIMKMCRQRGPAWPSAILPSSGSPANTWAA